jgi:sec-independent protein translocase protein TatB
LLRQVQDETMFDMSWGEVMVIGAVALVVIGPKDLPKALRTVGQMTGKIKRMAAEFQGQFAEAMREAELDDVKRQIQGVNESVGSFNPMQTIRDEFKGAVDSVSKAVDPSPTETVAAGSAEQSAAVAPPDVPPVEEPLILGFDETAAWAPPPDPEPEPVAASEPEPVAVPPEPESVPSKAQTEKPNETKV